MLVRLFRPFRPFDLASWSPCVAGRLVGACGARRKFTFYFGYEIMTCRDQIPLQLSRPHFATFWISTNGSPVAAAACRQLSCSLDCTLRPQRFTQACPRSSKCFSLPFLLWLGRRPLRPALEAQPHRSQHLVGQDTLPLCQWPGLRRWSRPRRRRRKRRQNQPKRIKSRAAKDGR